MPFEVIHQFLHLLGILFGYFGCRIVVIVVYVKEFGEEVFRLLVVLISHAECRVVCSDAYELVTVQAASAIASDDTNDLPILNLIEELTPRYAYFAYE